MGKIGSFKDDLTGKIYNINTDYFPLLKLKDHEIYLLNKKAQKEFINYEFSATNNNKIRLTAKSSVYKNISATTEFPAEIFSKILLSVYLSNAHLDTSDFIIDKKRMLLKKIKDEYRKNDFLIIPVSIFGIGFICSQGVRVLTIERIGIYKDTDKYKILLHKCVGSVNLKNLINPSIEFYTNTGYKLTVESIEFITGKYDSISNYIVRAYQLSYVINNDEPIEYEKFNNVSNNNVNKIEKFIHSRKLLLIQFNNIIKKETYKKRISSFLDDL